MDKEAPLNSRTFKTKLPDDEWSTPYDRALQNTAYFCERNDDSSVYVGFFKKVPTETNKVH